MTIKIIFDGRRLLVHAFGWSLIDLDVLTPLRKPALAAVPGLLDRDPHGTLSAQVEQADEPSPGFGFAGSVAPVVACGQPSPQGILCRHAPGRHVHSWEDRP